MLAIELWSWCLKRNIFVSAEHIPGSSNVRADYESRREMDASDWCLQPDCFRRIVSHLGHCEIDLFAAHHNAQLPRFYAWKPDPSAEKIDAFAQVWTFLHGYAFPPFNLVGKVLQKVLDESIN